MNVEEDNGNTNPKVGKTSNESHNFQAKWLKEHTWLRYKKENQAMIPYFCRLGKKKISFGSDKGCSNFKTMTLIRHLFCDTKMLQVNVLKVLILFSINKILEDKKLLKLFSILSYTQLQTETGEKVTVHTTMLSVSVELKA